jgi:hypothetical protein
MRNRHLDALVTWRAQRHQIPKVIRDINEQVLASAFDVVDIKSTPARARFCAAHTTHLVAPDNRQSGALPSATVFEPFAAPVVGMSGANRGVLSAHMRAKASATLCLARKCAKLLSAMRAGQLFSGYKAGVPALEGAVPNSRVARSESYPADRAVSSEGPGSSLCRVTFARTESHCRRALHLVSRTIKLLAAVSALKRRAILHRFRRAGATAKTDLGIVSAKFSLTLGACLEQG